MLGIKPDIGLTRCPSLGFCLGKRRQIEALLGDFGTPQLRRCGLSATQLMTYLIPTSYIAGKWLVANTPLIVPFERIFATLMPIV